MSSRARLVVAAALVVVGGGACGGSSGDPRDAAVVDAAGDLAHEPAGSCRPGEPAVIPAVETVEVTVTNSATSDRWLAVMGASCTPFAVAVFDGLNDNVVFFRAGPWCPCGCPQGPLGVTRYRHLATGAAYSLSWPATELAMCTVASTCDGGGSGRATLTGASPVEAGLYRIVVGYETAAPAGCTASGDDWTCTPASSAPPLVASFCPASGSASAQVTLQGTADADGSAVRSVSINLN